LNAGAGISLTFITDLFFDVATQSTVLKGSQANTFPFGKAPANLSSIAVSVASANEISPTRVVKAAASTGVCAPASTVTVTATAGSGDRTADVITTAPAAASVTPVSKAATGSLNFGSCTNPAVEFVRSFHDD
jgi:hypothetical protein